MAFFKGSYYEKLKVFDPAEDGSTPFRGVRARPIADPEPILEHAVAVNDRLDALAQHYYANPRDWRRMVDCNPFALFPEDLIYDEDTPPRDQPLTDKLGNVVLVPRRRDGR
ncbi:MAG: hypothetical protein GY952_07440 [Rhodobacteraceae bacterium]|nr:hypothetical protein [Paracoccaceae bacterium]